MSITIQVPDGRRVELPTDDLEVAKKAAANWAVKNPAPENAPHFPFKKGNLTRLRTFTV